MIDLFLLFTVTSAYLVYSFIQKAIYYRNLPPGPRGLPFVGYLPFIGDHKNVKKLSQKYGPVFSARLGVHDFVFLNDWESIKQAFASDDLLARPTMGLSNTIISDLSFIEMSGVDWREHRRVSLRILRDVGFGKSALEDLIADEFVELTKDLSKHVGTPIDLRNYIMASTSNVASQLVIGKRFPFGDSEKRILEENFRILASRLKFYSPHIVLPWLALLMAFFSKTYQEFARASLAVDNFFKVYFLKRKSKRMSHSLGDYLDGFLEKMKEKEDQGNIGSFTEPIAIRNMVAVFGALAETTSTASTWTTLYLVKFPELQERVRQEIMQVIGNRSVSYEYRHQMPYTMAFLHEVLRIRPPLVLNLLRRATDDVIIKSYLIRKNTLVCFNIWAVNHDPNLWPDPETFNPDRFLSENGKEFVSKPYLVTFSGGKRICPGESMAKVELFYYSVSLLQRFRLRATKKVQDVEKFSAVSQPLEMPDILLETL